MTKAKERISTAEQPARLVASRDADDIDQSPTLPLVVLPHASAESSLARALPSAAAVLDLGDKDCGDGPLEEIARALRQMPTNSGLEVHTTNGDVAIAVLVWCRLVGHNVMEQNTGRFFILPAPPRTPRLPPLRE